MDAKVRMHMLWIVSVEYQFASKLETGMDTISLFFEMLSDKSYLFLPSIHGASGVVLMQSSVVRRNTL
jgi:hypothetical protein